LAEHFENRVLRPIRVYMDRMTLDGLLNVYLGWRTQDELNSVGRPTLTLESPQVVAGEWNLDEGPIVINKSSILFATEIPDVGATLSREPIPPQEERFDYSAIRLNLGAFDAEGYVYTSQGVSAVGRLSLASHTFIALRGASIVGPDVDVVLPFVAINRFHVVVAQELFSVSAVQEEETTPGMSSP
jgi:hypothetical protein